MTCGRYKAYGALYMVVVCLLGILFLRTNILLWIIKFKQPECQGTLWKFLACLWALVKKLFVCRSSNLCFGSKMKELFQKDWEQSRGISSNSFVIVSICSIVAVQITSVISCSFAGTGTTGWRAVATALG